jgi:hypothetical protein
MKAIRNPIATVRLASIRIKMALIEHCDKIIEEGVEMG